MPTFDIVSSVSLPEINNAVDQANREIKTRFDFKDVEASFTLSNKTELLIKAPTEFQVQQMVSILENKCAKRGIDIRAIKYDRLEKNLNEARQTANVQQGINNDLAKTIVKRIKSEKIKVQASIQGDKVRVSGKKRDDLQSVIQLLKNEKFELPLQYENFRDN